MKPEEEIAIVRRAFAKQILAVVMLDDSRLQAAFAAVPRERFLGTGPWVIPRWGGLYLPTPSADPVYLYIDNVVQIIGDRCINNGQPSGHALWISSAGIKEGEHVVHIGIGTGYYTAILAHLVGSSGRVTAIEIDPDLAERSRHNLSDLPQVQVLEGDGATLPFEDADAIYVNAGVTRPPDRWLHALTEGGRLVLPLTTDQGFRNRDSALPIEKAGAMFRIERRGNAFPAKWVSPVAIIPCASARDAASEAALAEAFQKGGWKSVTQFHRGDDIPTERCWLRAPGWCLTTD